MLVLVYLVIILIFIVYINGKCNEYYWRKRGVVFWKKNKTLGVFWEYLAGKKSMFQLFDDLYKEHPDVPAIAFGSLTTPSILIRDVSNIHHMMITDFQSFNHRGVAYRDDDLLANNLAFIHGPKWKLVRQALTPLFTPAKLKNKHYIIDKCARDLIEYIKSNPDKLKSDTYSTMKSFSCAALTASVFGMGTESIFDSPFIGLSREALAATNWRNFKFSLSGMSPRLFNLLGLSLFSVREQCFVDTMRRVIRERKEAGYDNRNDFVDLCVNLQKGGPLTDPDTGFILHPTDEILAAQAYVFFIAGIEPVAAGLFATLFEIGRNPKIQNHVQRELDTIFEKYKGQLPCDAILEMKYLAKVIKEALRMHPPLGFITRQCINDTKLPNGNIKIDKGTKLYVSLYSLHYDPKYYSDPMVCNPNRFDNENELTDVYMPFGTGNRHCIGKRYVGTLIITCIAHLLRHFDAKSVFKNGQVKYKKEHYFVRLDDVDVAMIPRK